MKQETLVKILFAVTFLVILTGIFLVIMESSLPVIFLVLFALVYSIIIALVIALDNKYLLTKSCLFITNVQVPKNEDMFMVDFSDKLHKLNLETQKNIDNVIDVSRQLCTIKENLEMRYVGAVTTRKYHDKYCRFAGQIKDSNKVKFKFESDAKKNGFKKCKCLKF